MSWLIDQAYSGFTWDSVIQKMSDAQWDDIIGFHLNAPLRILRAAQPVIIDADGRPADHAQCCQHRFDCRHRRRRWTGQQQLCEGGGHRASQDAGQGVGRYDTTVNCVAFGLIHSG